MKLNYRKILDYKKYIYFYIYVVYLKCYATKLVTTNVNCIARLQMLTDRTNDTRQHS